MILLMTTDISNIDYDKYITESVADEDDYNAHIIVLKLLLKRYIYFLFLLQWHGFTTQPTGACHSSCQISKR